MFNVQIIRADCTEGEIIVALFEEASPAHIRHSAATVTLFVQLQHYTGKFSPQLCFYCNSDPPKRLDYREKSVNRLESSSVVRHLDSYANIDLYPECRHI